MNEQNKTKSKADFHWNITTSLNKQILCPVTKDKETKYQDSEELTKATWEKIRRKPQYQKLCDGIDFHISGVIKPSWYVYGHAERDNSLEKNKQARLLFGITQLIDSSKTYEDLDPAIRSVGIISAPIEAIAPKYSEFPIWTKPEESNDPRRFIEDGKYLTLKIDITKKDKTINEAFQLYLKFYRQFTRKEQGRTHPEKETEIYFKVWDERLKRIPFSEIALKLRTNEEAVRKQFGRAFELIIERKYNRDVWKELIKENLIKDKNYESLLDLEEPKQQQKLTSDGEIERILYDSSSLFDDPMISLYVEDISQNIVNNYCQNCPDSKCRSLVFVGDLDGFRNCPQAIDFIETYIKD